MPTYGYRCPKCRSEYDKLQKITDTTPADCPKCGTPGERLISGGAGIVFKGSGFYETDYKRAGTKQKQDAKDGGDSKPAKNADPTKSDKSKTKKPKPKSSGDAS